jgi:hyperosmotically inducible periplasmic protein
MKSVLALSYLMAGAALYPAAGFAQSTADAQIATDQTATGQSQDTTQAAANSPIASKIKTEMAAEHVPSMNSISVDADASGVVSLTGSAGSQADVDKVVSIAHNTAGVTAVNNNVTVQQ